MFIIFCFGYKMWAIPTGASWKKKNQVRSPSLESRDPELGSDPPIGSDRESGRDNICLSRMRVKYPVFKTKAFCSRKLTTEFR